MMADDDADAAGDAARPQSAGPPTPLRAIASGHTAFALPPRRAFADPRHRVQLPPLTVEQMARRAAPPVMRCGGTLVHDEMRFAPSVSAA
jgi:hypothetical protein